MTLTVGRVAGVSPKVNRIKVDSRIRRTDPPVALDGRDLYRSDDRTRPNSRRDARTTTGYAGRDRTVRPL